MNYFISTFRYKMACVFLAGAIITVVNGWLNGIPAKELLASFGVSITFMLIVSFILWLPAFKYALASPTAVWDMWGNAGKSTAREMFEGVTFARVYNRTKYGLLKEPSGGYRVAATLASCTCQEFRKTHTPCIHMCKLADILGVYEFNG
jgi:energy-coupling factor transporter transmembrane protein EcfT